MEYQRIEPACDEEKMETIGVASLKRKLEITENPIFMPSQRTYFNFRTLKEFYDAYNSTFWSS
jgi:hypothetical protein